MSRYHYKRSYLGGSKKHKHDAFTWTAYRTKGYGSFVTHIYAWDNPDIRVPYTSGWVALSDQVQPDGYVSCKSIHGATRDECVDAYVRYMKSEFGREEA